MDNNTERFELIITVDSDDIDQLGHVNNVVYLNWVQDLAIAHWNEKASEEDKEKLLWVVVRHEIDYKRPAFLNDEIIGYTWVGKAPGLSFERHSDFILLSDKKILVRARTIWCPIDKKSGKPTEVSPEV